MIRRDFCVKSFLKVDKGDSGLFNAMGLVSQICTVFENNIVLQARGLAHVALNCYKGTIGHYFSMAWPLPLIPLFKDKHLLNLKIEKSVFKLKAKNKI